MKTAKAVLFSNEKEIGKVTLSVGDFMMGGVVGDFFPNEVYLTEIQHFVWNFWENYDKYNDYSVFFMEQLRLQIQLENGLFLNPLGGIVLEDFSAEEPVKHLEMAGIDTEIIEKYIL